jgi:hypothetical protein
VSDRKPPWLVAGLVLLAVATLWLGAMLVLDAMDPPPSSAPDPKEPRPTAPAGYQSQRIGLEPPPGVDRPALPREPPKPALLTPDDRRAMNFAVDDVVKAAKRDCLLPWLAKVAPDATSEFVIDAVLYDGRVVDIGLRSLDRELPPDVTSCVADRAWLSDWPEWDLPGELRLQREFDLTEGTPP